MENTLDNESIDRPPSRWSREDRKVSKDPRIQQIIDDHKFIEGRPTSRRGNMSRQGSVMEDRPYTQHNMTRPVTSGRHVIARPPTGTVSPHTLIPGTASRLTSAMMQYPSSRAGTAINMVGAQLNVMERPITQQGLSGMRTSSKGPQMRQVQDKRYFEGLLQMKIKDISMEISRLTHEIEDYTREQATYLVYDKRVKEMAAELTELQGRLADYNLVVDKLNSDIEKVEVDAETQDLIKQNEEDSRIIEQLFAQRQQKEFQISQLEKEIEQEKHMTDNLLTAMNPELRANYFELQKTNNELLHEMEQLQIKLDSLSSEKSGLETQINISQMKQEAVRLHHKLLEAEERRNTLLEEEKTRSTPAQEREQLLKQVKDDNVEMSAMERQITELKDSIRRKQEDLEQMEKDLVESQSERHQKYRELRRREETMENFLSSFEQSRDEETERIKKLEEEIVTTLGQISHHLTHSSHLPSVDDYLLMKDNLLFKESELEKSKSTAESVVKEHQQLQQTLQKVEDLKDKIISEKESLKERIAEMKKEIVKFENLDSLRDEAQYKRSLLNSELQELLEKKDPVKSTLQSVKQKHSKLEKQLNENETYVQLSNLERKLAQLEQNNFAIQEFIAAKKSETDYESQKDNVLSMVKNYNNLLKENLKMGNPVLI